MLYEAAVSLITFDRQRPDSCLSSAMSKSTRSGKSQTQLKYIAIRAIDTLLKSQGVGDLFRLYTYAQRDNYDYKPGLHPGGFHRKGASTFDTAYMNQLFQLAITWPAAATVEKISAGLQA